MSAEEKRKPYGITGGLNNAGCHSGGANLLMVIEHHMKLISPTDAMRNAVYLIVQLFVGVFTLFLLTYF